MECIKVLNVRMVQRYLKICSMLSNATRPHSGTSDTILLRILCADVALVSGCATTWSLLPFASVVVDHLEWMAGTRSEWTMIRIGVSYAAQQEVWPATYYSMNVRRLGSTGDNNKVDTLS